MAVLVGTDPYAPGGPLAGQSQVTEGAPAGQDPFTGGITGEQTSAKELVRRQLAAFGLEALGEWMWQEYMNGKPEELIWLEMRDRPEYQARFPGMKELQAKGRAISEAAYIEYERTATQIMRAAGIPDGMMSTREAIGGMIAGEVSLKEFEDRLTEYQVAAFQSPKEVKDELNRLYGIGEGELLGFFLADDATLPQLMQRWIAAQASGAAIRSGYGQLQRDVAERLASLGATGENIVQGFNFLGRSKELFGALPGFERSEEEITQEEQFSGVFEGSGAAEEKIKRRQRQRQAQFEGGGQFAAGSEGIGGIGSAR